MNRTDFLKRVERAKCRVFGAGEPINDGHRAVAVALIEAFDVSESALLIEPSLSRKTTRPPDVVLVDPEAGVHVLEVKAVQLEQVVKLEAGGTLEIRYAASSRKLNPISQVRMAMFDIKDATGRAHHGDLTIPFRYWVVFPSIHRVEWMARFGRDGFCPPEYLFAEDLGRDFLLRRMGASDRSAAAVRSVRVVNLEQLQCVWTAFGDNSVLYCRSEHRPERKAYEGSLGERFDRQALSLKRLSDEQQRLSEMHWESGPRLVRGVAGSGKTVVLANNLARRARRLLVEASSNLFEKKQPLRIAALCFNRTLAPFIQSKVELAFEQRTGVALPNAVVVVRSFNRLVWDLSRQGVWPYEKAEGGNISERAERYLGHLLRFKRGSPQAFARVGFESIYVDEGQDFVEAEYRVLRELCLTTEQMPEPNLFVFYDDAQNLYGRKRPNWASLGLNIRGRAFVMTQCFRNPRPVVEASFNVLYGTAAADQRLVPSREFGDIGTLLEKGLIEQEAGRWRIRFAQRGGMTPLVTQATDPAREIQLVLARLTILTRDNNVRPQDILVLTHSRERALELADAIKRAKIEGVDGVHVAFKDRDSRLCPPRQVTVSTVHSAKGYDAFVVLLVSANEFKADVTGRACFYVGCTRAVEYLEVFGYEATGLFAEMKAVVAGYGG